MGSDYSQECKSFGINWPSASDPAIPKSKIGVVQDSRPVSRIMGPEGFVTFDVPQSLALLASSTMTSSISSGESKPARLGASISIKLRWAPPPGAKLMMGRSASTAFWFLVHSDEGWAPGNARNGIWMVDLQLVSIVVPELASSCVLDIGVGLKDSYTGDGKTFQTLLKILSVTISEWLTCNCKEFPVQE